MDRAGQRQLGRPGELAAGRSAGVRRRCLHRRNSWPEPKERSRAYVADAGHLAARRRWPPRCSGRRHPDDHAERPRRGRREGRHPVRRPGRRCTADPGPAPGAVGRPGDVRRTARAVPGRLRRGGRRPGCGTARRRRRRQHVRAAGAHDLRSHGVRRRVRRCVPHRRAPQGAVDPRSRRAGRSGQSRALRVGSARSRRGAVRPGVGIGATAARDLGDHATRPTPGHGRGS